jgi:hypothetical protein
VTAIPGYDAAWLAATNLGITDLTHLKWGFYRFYVDALLFFGSIRNAYRHLRGLDERSISWFFADRRFNTERLGGRGKQLPTHHIPEAHRHLVSEMACKSYAPADATLVTARQAVTTTMVQRLGKGPARVRVADLVTATSAQAAYNTRADEFSLATTDFADEEVESAEELENLFVTEGKHFKAARRAAEANTKLYLSMVDDLDVYVATSMRTKEDFLSMASFCDGVFRDSSLADLQLRHFDPTLSGAGSHEDKGIIECLMVKSARALVYFAGTKDSWGKVAEASMALSLGKPVILYCSEEERGRFFREVHPLSRLIDFETGVAVGAMVASTQRQVVELLGRIFRNEMQYVLTQPKRGYLKLDERVSRCTVRLQTSDALLRETFWNYYHRQGAYGASAPALPPIR